MTTKAQPDLFSLRYPDVPGFKRRGTSSDAAKSIHSEAPKLREDCLDAIRSKPRTADEVADALGKSVLAVRPRLSELVALRKIIETGERRPNTSGKMASVWRVL